MKIFKKFLKLFKRKKTNFEKFQDEMKKYKWKAPKDEKSFAESLHDLNPNNLFKNKKMYGMYYGHRDCRCLITSRKPYNPDNDIFWMEEAQEIKEKDYNKLKESVMKNKKPMSDKEVLEALRKAEIAFRRPPVDEENNESGLCLYFEESLDLTEEQSAYILGEKHGLINYRFCNGNSQEEVYAKKKNLYYERADWCRERMKDFQPEKKKVIFKNLACRICGVPAETSSFHNGLCPNNSDHKIEEFSVPFEMKLKKEIKFPEIGRMIKLIEEDNTINVGFVCDGEDKNMYVYIGKCRGNFEAVININHIKSWKYLKEA